jgi:FkbM family methyltransferase
VFGIRPLSFSRPSGIQIRIASDADWTIYTEIFRKGEYDRPINLALSTLRTPRATVLDLGANVGFFTLRVIEATRASASGIDVGVIVVEGSPRTMAEFCSRVLDENKLAEQVAVHGGLVGERTGSATLADGRRHGETSLFRPGRRTATGIDVPFIDASRLLALDALIDLLKCDIESAELSFITNYRDLLQRTRVAVFEFHDDLCDTEACRRMLRSCGFSREEVLRHEGPYSLHCVWR